MILNDENHFCYIFYIQLFYYCKIKEFQQKKKYEIHRNIYNICDFYTKLFLFKIIIK